MSIVFDSWILKYCIFFDLTTATMYILYTDCTYCREPVVWRLNSGLLITLVIKTYAHRVELLDPYAMRYHYQSYQSRSKFRTTAYCTVHYARQASVQSCGYESGSSPFALESLHRCHRRQNCPGGDWGPAGHTHAHGAWSPNSAPAPSSPDRKHSPSVWEF